MALHLREVDCAENPELTIEDRGGRNVLHVPPRSEPLNLTVHLEADAPGEFAAGRSYRYLDCVLEVDEDGRSGRLRLTVAPTPPPQRGFRVGISSRHAAGTDLQELFVVLDPTAQWWGPAVTALQRLAAAPTPTVPWRRLAAAVLLLLLLPAGVLSFARSSNAPVKAPLPAAPTAFGVSPGTFATRQMARHCRDFVRPAWIQKMRWKGKLCWRVHLKEKFPTAAAARARLNDIHHRLAPRRVYLSPVAVDTGEVEPPR